MAKTDDELDSSENSLNRVSGDESSKSANGSPFENEMEASKQLESDSEELDSTETKDGNDEKTLESVVPAPKVYR